MKLKTLPPILAVLALALSPASAFAQSPTNRDVRVVCEKRNGTPTTIIRGQKDQPIFHWHDGSVPSENVSQLCQDAAQNLQKYLQQGGQQTSFDTYETGDQLDVCVDNGELDEEKKECLAILFSLSLPEPGAKDILGQIFDPQLKPKTPEDERLYGRYSFDVPWWQLVY